MKLKSVLEDTYLSNPEYREKYDEMIDIESGVEVECIDVEIEELTEVFDEEEE